jgi:hypothetical protein
MATTLACIHAHSLLSTRSWRDLAFTIALAFDDEVSRLSMLICVLADSVRAPLSVRQE